MPGPGPLTRSRLLPRWPWPGPRPRSAGWPRPGWPRPVATISLSTLGDRHAAQATASNMLLSRVCEDSTWAPARVAAAAPRGNSMHPSKQTKDKVGYARLRPSHCEPNPYNICRCAPNQRSRFQSIFVLIVCVLLPTVNGFRTVSRVNCIQAAIHTNRLYTGTKPSYASRQVPGIASLFEKNLRMKFT